MKRLLPILTVVALAQGCIQANHQSSVKDLEPKDTKTAPSLAVGDYFGTLQGRTDYLLSSPHCTVTLTASGNSIHGETDTHVVFAFSTEESADFFDVAAGQSRSGVLITALPNVARSAGSVTLEYYTTGFNTLEIGTDAAPTHYKCMGLSKD